MNKNQIIELLDQVSNQSKDDFSAYLIGGGSLIFWDLQEYTKDIDLIVNDRYSLNIMFQNLIKLGFRIFSDGIEVTKVIDKPFSVIRDQILVDVFYSKTTHFSITNSMISRAKSLHINNNCIHVVSQEDIFLLKTATGRQSDSSVLKNIVSKYKLDWEVILDEVAKQHEIGNIRASYDLFAASIEANLFNSLPVEVKDTLVNAIKRQVKSS